MVSAPKSEIAQWPKDTAGHRMTRKVPTAYADQTVSAIRSLVLHTIHVFKSIDYVYVLDRGGHLIGVMSLKDLYEENPRKRIRDVCKTTSLVTAHPQTHQERVVYLALKNNIKAIPVVDADCRFLGTVLNDTILTILYKEAHEDLLRLVGVRHPRALAANVFELTIWESVRHRLPWLFFGLIGGMLSAKIIGAFEHTLERNILLASFIPLVVYISDAVGTQMEAYMIRDLALDRHLRFSRYFCRQFLIVLIIAMICSTALMGFSLLFYRASGIGLTLGLSLFAAIISSVCTGLVVPYTFSRFRLDPADASGPIATIVQDILSVVIYFSVATWLL